jgi:flagellar basal body-associated protein FliL
MPGLLTGVLPAFAGIFTGNMMILILGMLFTLAAGGDFISLWMLRKAPENSYAEDHPDKNGCYLYLSKTM